MRSTWPSSRLLGQLASFRQPDDFRTSTGGNIIEAPEATVAGIARRSCLRLGFVVNHPKKRQLERLQRENEANFACTPAILLVDDGKSTAALSCSE
jgi:hypothetical protein